MPRVVPVYHGAALFLGLALLLVNEPAAHASGAKDAPAATGAAGDDIELRCGKVGWNAVAVLLTSPCNSAPAGGNVSARVEVWLPDDTRARCPVHLVVALVPVSGTPSLPPLSSVLLPAISQDVMLPSPPTHIGWVQISARLVLQDSYREVGPHRRDDERDGDAGVVIAEDGRDVQLLACSLSAPNAQILREHERDLAPGGSTAEGSGTLDSSTLVDDSCCLVRGFASRPDPPDPHALDARRGGDTGRVGRELRERRAGDHEKHGNGGSNARTGGEGNQKRTPTPRVAHFVFDVKGPPPRCSYFFFVAVRAAARVLRRQTQVVGEGRARGAGGGGWGVIVHYHYEPWGAWWAAIRALPNVRVLYVELPTQVFGRRIDFFAHHSDVIRLHALLRFGGVYFDSDLVMLSPMRALFEDGRAFLGEQPFGWAGNGVIGAPSESPFISRWIQQYETFLDARRGFWGAFIPTVISWAYPEDAMLLGPEAFYWPFQHIGVTLAVFSSHLDFAGAGNLVAHFYGGSFQRILDGMTPRMLRESDGAVARVLREEAHLLGDADLLVGMHESDHADAAAVAVAVAEEEQRVGERESEAGGGWEVWGGSEKGQDRGTGNGWGRREGGREGVDDEGEEPVCEGKAEGCRSGEVGWGEGGARKRKVNEFGGEGRKRQSVAGECGDEGGGPEWLAWWPLLDNGRGGDGEEQAGGGGGEWQARGEEGRGVKGDARREGGRKGTQVTRDVGPMGLHAHLVREEWLDVGGDEGRRGCGRHSNGAREGASGEGRGAIGGAQGVFEGTGGVGLRVGGGGDVVFAPLFGCVGALALSLCLDLVFEIDEPHWEGQVPENGGLPEGSGRGRRIVWLIQVGDDSMVWLEWCAGSEGGQVHGEERKRNRAEGGEGGAGTVDGGFSLRFRRVKREYELLFVAAADLVADAATAATIVTALAQRMRVCVSLEAGAPSLLWINQTLVGRSRRTWRYDGDCGRYGGFGSEGKCGTTSRRGDMRGQEQQASAGEEEQQHGCANAWWPLADSGLGGVWLGGSPLPIVGKSGGGGLEGERGAGLRVSNFGVYGGYLADAEALRRAEERGRKLREWGEGETGADDVERSRGGEERRGGDCAEADRGKQWGMRVVVEEPGMFSFQRMIDEAIEPPYMASQAEHPNCVRVVVRIESRTGGNVVGDVVGEHETLVSPMGDHASDAEELQLQVWLDGLDLGGAEVLNLPNAHELEPPTATATLARETSHFPGSGAHESGAQLERASFKVERRKFYLCKIRKGQFGVPMVWRSIRVAVKLEENQLGSDTVMFAEMDRLFELGGWCRGCFVRPAPTLDTVHDREGWWGGGRVGRWWLGDVGEVPSVTQLPAASVHELGAEALQRIVQDMWRGPKAAGEEEATRSHPSLLPCHREEGEDKTENGELEYGIRDLAEALKAFGGGGGGGTEAGVGQKCRAYGGKLDGSGLPFWVVAGIGRYVVGERWVGGGRWGGSASSGVEGHGGRGAETTAEEERLLVEAEVEEAVVNEGRGLAIGCARYSLATVRLAHCAVLDPVLQFAVLHSGSRFMVDLGCGAPSFLSSLLTAFPDLHYVGFDLSDTLIVGLRSALASLREEGGGEGVGFGLGRGQHDLAGNGSGGREPGGERERWWERVTVEQSNVSARAGVAVQRLQRALSRADLVVCVGLFGYLRLAEVWQVLSHIRASGVRYLLVSSHDVLINSDSLLVAGHYRPVNLLRPPFSELFPPHLRYAATVGAWSQLTWPNSFHADIRLSASAPYSFEWLGLDDFQRLILFDLHAFGPLWHPA